MLFCRDLIEQNTLDSASSRVLTLLLAPPMKPKSFFLFLSLVCFTAEAGLAAPAEDDSTAIVSHIPREHVQSTGLAGVGYSKRRHILEIEFINGAVYRYVDVPPLIYRELMSAESKAGYYASHIKKHYRSVRVRPRVKDQLKN
ncbi:MAG: hypothetical protein QOI96_148 [Verrucomicrobiota bacterium]